MTRYESEPYSLLIEIARSPDVSAVNDALKLARIPFYSGLLAGAPPRVLFYVPAARLDEARRALARHVEQGLPAGPEPDEPEPDLLEEIEVDRDRGFPWIEVRTVAAMVLAHLLQVLWVVGPWPPGRELLQLGGLVPGQTMAQPWRLVTSLFLHADPSHVLWNGLAMLVFAVPLLVRLGLPRTALIYLVAGTGGGVAAVAFADPGVVIIGSSGAVAGLFGAWIVLTLRASRQMVLGWRARVRTLGIALLFLPSLLNPTTSSGRPVSVSSHLGGLAAGMLIGALLSSRMGPRQEPAAATTATAPNPD